MKAERRGINTTLVETNLPTLDSHPQPTSDVALKRTGRKPEEFVRLSESQLIQPLILESNCYGALGALGSVQASAGTPFSRLGMVWIDAHGDCVSQPASQIGKTLSSMDPHEVVMVCVRADDPLEQAVIDQSACELLEAVQNDDSRYRFGSCAFSCGSPPSSMSKSGSRTVFPWSPMKAGCAFIHSLGFCCLA